MNQTTTPTTRLATEVDADLETAPTVAPAALAIGIMLIPWGLLTHGIVTLAGIGVMTWAIGKWILEIRKEWSADDRASS